METKGKIELHEIVVSKVHIPEDFEKTLFVVRAFDKSNPTKFTSVLHAENARSGSRIIATDGKRMHVAVIKIRIPAGNYVPSVQRNCITLHQVESIQTFPNWKCVIPEKLRFKAELDLTQTSRLEKEKNGEKMSVAYNTLISKSGRLINLHFLEELPKRKWKLYSENEKNKVLVLRDSEEEDSLYAVIAPLAA